MKNVWIVQDEYNDHVVVCSNPKKAYRVVLSCWRNDEEKPPSYSKFLKEMRQYHYSNETTTAYKQNVI